MGNRSSHAKPISLIARVRDPSSFFPVRQASENRAEAEFYKKKQLPPEIQKGLNDADFEIKAQQSVIESKKKPCSNFSN